MISRNQREGTLGSKANIAGHSIERSPGEEAGLGSKGGPRDDE